MYPVCLDITDRLCIVVGGGKVAERKTLALLTAGAQVRVISPKLSRGLAHLAADKKIDWRQRFYRQGDLTGALLVFAATDNREVQESITREAARKGLLINVIDAPASCSFQVPAVVRRGDLTLAVSTGGKSPALATGIRKELEANYGEEYGRLLEILSQLREQLLSGEENCRERRILFQKILHDDIVLWVRNGRWDRLRRHLRSVLGTEVDITV